MCFLNVRDERSGTNHQGVAPVLGQSFDVPMFFPYAVGWFGLGPGEGPHGLTQHAIYQARWTGGLWNGNGKGKVVQ